MQYILKIKSRLSKYTGSILTWANTTSFSLELPDLVRGTVSKAVTCTVNTIRRNFILNLWMPRPNLPGSFSAQSSSNVPTYIALRPCSVNMKSFEWLTVDIIPWLISETRKHKHRSFSRTNNGAISTEFITQTTQDIFPQVNKPSKIMCYEIHCTPELL